MPHVQYQRFSEMFDHGRPFMAFWWARRRNFREQVIVSGVGMPPAILAKLEIAKNLPPSRCFTHHLMGARDGFITG
jgi:hypothetical protein